MFLSAYASNIVCIFVLSFSLKEVIFSPVTFAKSPVGITRMVTVFSGSVFFLPKTNPPGGMIGFTARETARVARRPPCDPVERIDGFAAPPLVFGATLLAGDRRWLSVAAGGGVRAVRCRPPAVPSAARGVLGVRARFQPALCCELDPKGQVPTNCAALSNLGCSW